MRTKGLIGQICGLLVGSMGSSGKTDRFHCWEWMARFDGPIYPQLGPKILGIRALKVHNGQCDLQWKKVALDQLFSTVQHIKTCIRDFGAYGCLTTEPLIILSGGPLA